MNNPFILCSVFSATRTDKIRQIDLELSGAQHAGGNPGQQPHKVLSDSLTYHVERCSDLQCFLPVCVNRKMATIMEHRLSCTSRMRGETCGVSQKLYRHRSTISTNQSSHTTVTSDNSHAAPPACNSHDDVSNGARTTPITPGNSAPQSTMRKPHKGRAQETKRSRGDHARTPPVKLPVYEISSEEKVLPRESRKKWSPYTKDADMSQAFRLKSVLSSHKQRANHMAMPHSREVSDMVSGSSPAVSRPFDEQVAMAPHSPFTVDELLEFPIMQPPWGEQEMSVHGTLLDQDLKDIDALLQKADVRNDFYDKEVIELNLSDSANTRIPLPQVVPSFQVSAHGTDQVIASEKVFNSLAMDIAQQGHTAANTKSNVHVLHERSPQQETIPPVLATNALSNQRKFGRKRNVAEAAHTHHQKYSVQVHPEYSASVNAPCTQPESSFMRKDSPETSSCSPQHSDWNTSTSAIMKGNRGCFSVALFETVSSLFQILELPRPQQLESFFIHVLENAVADMKRAMACCSFSKDGREVRNTPSKDMEPGNSKNKAKSIPDGPLEKVPRTDAQGANASELVTAKFLNPAQDEMLQNERTQTETDNLEKELDLLTSENLAAAIDSAAASQEAVPDFILKFFDSKGKLYTNNS